MKKCFVLGVLLTLSSATFAQSSDKEKVLEVVNQFFTTMEAVDSTGFQKLHVKDAANYVIGERDGVVKNAMRRVTDMKFDAKSIVKERMREQDTRVEVHERIAMVWAPYDLWVNEKYSHCGVDVFTLLKTEEGWKIASIAYTIEKKGCGHEIGR